MRTSSRLIFPIIIFGACICAAVSVTAQPTAPYSAQALPSLVNLHLPLSGALSSVSIHAAPTAPQLSASSDRFKAATQPTQSVKPSPTDFQTCDTNADVPTQAIYDLATSLKNDPGLIFHFVNNEIDLEPGVESSKGALGTYLDRSGSSFDQAALLLALLQVASTSNTQITNPQIVIGLVTVSAAQYGLSALPTQLLVDSGDAQTWANSSMVPYAWVQVTINGVQTVMDPADKTYVVFNGVSLSSYQPAAPSQTQSAIDTYLSSFALSIYQAGQNTSNWQLNDYSSVTSFLGGRRRPMSWSGAAYNLVNRPVATAQGATNGSVPSTTPSYYTSMPYSFRTVFSVALNGGQSGGVCLDQIYDHSVLVTKTNFIVDDVIVYSGNGSTSTTPFADTFMMTHQIWSTSGVASAWTGTAAESLTYLNGVAIQFSVGRVGAFRVREATKVSEDADMPGGGLTEKDFVSIGANELRQTSRGTQMLDQLAGTYTLNHHTVQFEHYTATSTNLSTVAQATSVAVDTPLLATSVDVITTTPASGLSVSPNAVAYALSALQSAQEAAAMNNANVPQSVSAATLMAGGSSSSPSTLVYLAKGSQPSSWPTSITQSYSPPQLTTLASYTATYDVAVPAASSAWGNSGNALAFFASQAGGISAFALQTPNSPPGTVYKGASSPNPIQPGGGTLGSGDMQSKPGPGGAGLSVNPQSGQVSFAAPLLSIGSKGSPYSLALSLAYSSDSSAQLTLGTGNAPGWAHNYNINLTLSSDPSALIGSNLVGATLPGVVSLYYLLQNANQLATYYVSGGSYPTTAVFDMASTANWYLQQSISDVAVISRGTSNETFLRMPDGTFHIPAPSGEKLVNNGSNFVWTAATGSTQIFPVAGGPIQSAATTSNVLTTFTYTSYGPKSLLSSVATSAPNNASISVHTLTFSYQPDSNANGMYLLSAVADETGRTVSFGYSGPNVLENQVNSISELIKITLVDSTVSSPRAIVPGYFQGLNTGDFWPDVGSVLILNSITDPLSNVTTVGYDTRYEAVQLTDANGNITHYYPAGDRWEVDDAMSNVSYGINYPNITVPTGQQSLLSTNYDALNNATTTYANDAGQITNKAFPSGVVDDYSYDGHGNLESTTVFPSVAGTALTSSTVWNQTWNKPATATDALGNATAYQYTSLGQLQKVTYPAVPYQGASVQPAESYDYYSDGQIAHHYAANSVVTLYTYDSTTHNISFITKDSQGLQLVTAFGHTSVGDIGGIRTPRGYTTSRTYDLARRLITEVTPPIAADNGKRHTTKYGYDLNGRLLTTSQDASLASPPAELLTTNTYDAVGNLKTKTMPTTGTTAHIITYSYDMDERLISTFDAASQTTSTVYDADGRVYKKLSNGSLISTNTYTSSGQPYQLIDGDGHLTTYSYDTYDRLIKTTYNNGTYEQLTLDQDGHVTTSRNRNGLNTNFAYDALGRVTSETVSSFGTPFTFTYDLANQPVTASDSTGTFTYAFDSVGDQTQTTRPDGKVILYGYDSDQNLVSMTYPDGYRYGYGRDEIARMTNVVEQPSGSQTVSTIADYSWDPLSRSTLLTYSNGSSTSYSYDNWSGLTAVTQTYASGSTVPSITYGYTRDNDERVESESVTYNGYIWHPPATATTTYSVNGLNEYTSITAGTTASTLTYDQNGNLNSDPTAPLGTATYGFDQLNRLTSATNTQHTANYTYDLFSRRSSKTVDNLGTVFVNDGNHTIADYTPSGLEAQHYVYGMGDTPILQEVFSNGGTTPSATRYVYADGRGSVVFFADTSGKTTDNFTYSPLGETIASTSTPYRYAGMRFDSETMLYYDNARYYSPQQGRFISPDPIGANGGINIYAYAGGDPLNNVDLSGLDEDPFCEGNCGGGGGGGGGYYVSSTNSMTDTAGDTGQSVTISPTDGTGPSYSESSVNNSDGTSSTYSDIPSDASSDEGSPLQTAFIASAPPTLHAYFPTLNPNGLGQSAGQFVVGSIVGAGTAAAAVVSAAGAVLAEGAADLSGTATINIFGASHMSITVTAVGETLTTGVGEVEGQAIVGLDTAEEATGSLSYPLPNGQAALDFAKSSIGNIGPYNGFTNSCVTYCGSVLDAGGVEGVPTGTGAITRWMGLR